MNTEPCTEVFRAEPPPDKAFYTITAMDIGRGILSTTAGEIDVYSVTEDTGHETIQLGDVGKRLYRHKNQSWSGPSHYWDFTPGPRDHL
jgi:hypothetical protein